MDHSTSFFVLFFLLNLSITLAVGYLLEVRPAQPANLSPRDAAASALHTIGEALGEGVKKGGKGQPLKRQLAAAGYRSEEALPIFNGISAALAMLLGVLAAAAGAIAQNDLLAALLAGVAGAGLGYLLPKRILRFMIVSRARRMSAGLPTALDFLVLSVESGQALDVAIYDTSREVRRAFPDLADELYQMTIALRASATRAEVFREFGDRHQEPELKKLANLLIDSDRFGVSLGPTLRTHARYLRIRRRQNAQESARKVSVKLIFPVFFLIFPSVLLVTLGPAVLQIMASLKPDILGN